MVTNLPSLYWLLLAPKDLRHASSTKVLLPHSLTQFTMATQSTPLLILSYFLSQKPTRRFLGPHPRPPYSPLETPMPSLSLLDDVAQELICYPNPRFVFLSDRNRSSCGCHPVSSLPSRPSGLRLFFHNTITLKFLKEKTTEDKRVTLSFVLPSDTYSYPSFLLHTRSTDPVTFPPM